MMACAALSCALAAAGFRAIRHATSRTATKTVPAFALKGIGSLLLLLAAWPMTTGATTPVIGAMLWLFCILPLAALPDIFLRHSRT